MAFDDIFDIEISFIKDSYKIGDVVIIKYTKRDPSKSTIRIL